MSDPEQPERLDPGRKVTVEDIRELMGASTPHFALQIRELSGDQEIYLGKRPHAVYGLHEALHEDQVAHVVKSGEEDFLRMVF